MPDNQEQVTNSPEDLKRGLRSYFERMELDERHTPSTLGATYTRVTPEVMLRATKKVLGISRQEDESDDRDSLEFQTVHDFGDFLSDKVKNDQQGLMKQLMWKVSGRTPDLSKVPSSLFDKHVTHLFGEAGLAQALEEVNPMDMHDMAQKVTRLGEGALPGIDSIPKEARSVNPSFINYIDPVRSVECYSDDTEVYTKEGWLLFSQLTGTEEIACLVNGKLEYNKPEALQCYPYEGVMLGGKSATMDYLVTPNHRMWVRPIEGKGYRFELAEDTHNKTRVFNSGKFIPYESKNSVTFFVLPVVEQLVKTPRNTKGLTDNSSVKNTSQEIPIEDWCAFLGWYVAEGSFVYDERRTYYATDISQYLTVNPENYNLIREDIKKLPFAFCEHSKGFRITGKQLASYLKQFGHSVDKRIPSYVFEAPLRAREIFIDRILRGDGTKSAYNPEIREKLSTCSKQLALDFQKLLFSVGRSSNITFHKETRTCFKNAAEGIYNIQVHTRQERIVYWKNHRHPEGQFLTQNYKGNVYCATVPGGLLYVRRNKKQGFWCGNSLKVGVDLNFARNVKKGPGNYLYTQFIDPKTNKKVWLSSFDSARSVIGFPEGMTSKDDFVPAIVNGKQMEYVPKSKINFYVPSGDDMMADAGMLVPMVNGVKGMRYSMGSKFVKSALPLEEPDLPYVMGEDIDGTPVNARLGRAAGAIATPVDGVVTRVGDSRITVRAADGTDHNFDMYKVHPLARKTYLNQDPIVKVGDKVKAGQNIAKSNYTDKTGMLAMTKNLRVAYMPIEGKNFEDSVVLSESAAQKLRSQVMYQDAFEPEEGISLNKTRFTQMRPGVFSKEQIDTIDDAGVIKKGTIVKAGDPLFLTVKETMGAAASIGRSRAAAEPILWEHDFPAEVVDVIKGDNGQYKLLTKAILPISPGDKVALPYGSKGVVSEIKKDTAMPKDSNGNPIELILSPLSIYSRTNPAQVIAAQLGKVAEKTGKRYTLKGFSDQDLISLAETELKKANLTDVEDLTDPNTNRKISGIMTGILPFYRLQQTAENKSKSRSFGVYTAEGEPAKGGGEFSKHLGDMEEHALLSHNVPLVFKDLKLVSGQRNDDYWRKFKWGMTPPTPDVPLVYKKFNELIKASGAEVIDNGKGAEVLFAMTNDKAKQLVGTRRLANADTYGAKTLQPLPGGLFDPDMTDALGNGEKWTAFDIPEPMLNPITEPMVRSLLGVTQKQLDDIIAGRVEVDGKRGGPALKTMLEKIDLKQLADSSLDTIKNGAASKRDAAVKKYGFAQALIKMNTKPADFMMDVVPVLPPKWRPITMMNGRSMVSDLNYLYKGLHDSVNDFKDTVANNLPASIQEEARLKMYNTYRAVTGTEDTENEKLKSKNISGALGQLLGTSSPKLSFVQRRVLGGNFELSGLGVITLNPKLKLNEIGLPAAEAWSIFEPFIIRHMVQKGHPAMEAAKAVENKTSAAWKALKQVMEDRPIIYNRAPSLHRYSMMAAKAKLTPGHTVQVPPTIVAPFGADFDGDLIINSLLVKFDSSATLLVESFKGKDFLKERELPVYYKQKLAVKQDEMVTIIALEDFPHLEEYRETITDKGPIRFYDVMPGVEVLAHNPNGGVTWAPVSNWSIHPDREIELVNLSSGKQLITDNDPRAVYGVCFENSIPARYTPTAALENNVLVPVCNKLSVTDTIKEIDVAPSKYNAVRTFLKNKVTLNADFGYLLGSLAGDGWITYHNDELKGQFNICGSDIEVLERFEAALASIFDGELPKRGETVQLKEDSASRYGNCTRFTYSCKVACEFLSSVSGRGCLNKHLPPFYLSAPLEFREGLFSGLMDTDGSISVSRGKKKPQLLVSFTNTSLRLIYEIKYLAASIGIKSTITSFKYRDNKEAWLVNFSTLDFVKWAGNKMVCKRKLDHLNNVLAQPDPDSAAAIRQDIVPMFKEILETASTLASADYSSKKEDKDFKSIYNALADVRKTTCKTKAISRTAAKKIKEMYGDKLAATDIGKRWLALVEDDAITWDRVISVEKTGTKVTGYDLSVPFFETFMSADGVILSNTVSYTVPVTAEAVSEAKRRMLPEKNLLSARNDQPHYVPAQEYTMGLHFATKDPKKKPVQRFQTIESAKKAYAKGLIAVDDPIEITG